jgi:hypothetical protein
MKLQSILFMPLTAFADGDSAVLLLSTLMIPKVINQSIGLHGSMYVPDFFWNDTYNISPSKHQYDI